MYLFIIFFSLCFFPPGFLWVSWTHLLSFILIYLSVFKCNSFCLSSCYYCWFSHRLLIFPVWIKFGDYLVLHPIYNLCLMYFFKCIFRVTPESVIIFVLIIKSNLENSVGEGHSLSRYIFLLFPLFSFPAAPSLLSDMLFCLENFT